MSDNISEQLTKNFYAWETRGRGWWEYNFPVDLEPPYRPFFHHAAADRFIDDGQVPTIFERIGKLFPKKKVEKEILSNEQDDPFPFLEDINLQSIEIHFNRDYKLDTPSVEQFLLMISSTEYPISFELIGEFSNIKMQLVCRVADSDYVLGQIRIFFPTLSFTTPIDIHPILKDDHYTFIKDFGLGEEFMRPILTVKSLDLDPLTGCIGILNTLQNNNFGGIQILFHGTGNPWSENIVRSIILPSGDSFFPDAPEMIPLVKDKVSSPLYAVSVKVFGQSRSANQAHTICQALGSTLRQATRSPSNSLIPLQSSCSLEKMAEDMQQRRSRRLGMLLNTKELMTLVHPLSPAILSSKFTNGDRKTKAVPSIAQGHQLVLGYNHHEGVNTPVSVSTEQRMNHMHVIGATGTGKSSLLMNCIIQDIDNNNGLCVLDPHGDLIDNILGYIPEHRHQDVIVVDPSNSEYTIGLNLLSAHSDIEKELIASDLVATFRRLSTSWGDQMNSVFSNAVLAFLESSVGGSLHDLKRFLVEKEFREQFLTTVQDEYVLYYWKKEYPILRSGSIGSILTRLDTFLRPKPIRNMVTQKKGLDFENVLNTKKILLVKLSQGLIGVENSYLLGTLFVSKIHQAALARQAKAKADRKNFYFYIDEFHNFITPSMSGMLSGVRKYHMGLILAHQEIHQIAKADSELANSIMANAGVRACFRVSEIDAKYLENGFASFDSYDLQNQNVREAVIRIERPGNDCNISTYELPKLDSAEVETRRNVIIDLSQKLHGTILNIVNQQPTEFVDEPIVKEKQPIFERIEVIKKEPINGKVTEDKAEMYKEKEKKKKTESEHRYLQTLIKKMAEARGYVALLEVPTPDGNGRIDVVLAKNGLKIACEITMTTTDTWESHNIEKCFDAGYEMVVICSTNKHQLQKIKAYIDMHMDPRLIKKLCIYQPEEFFLWMDQQNLSTNNAEQKIKGYRVKVNYGSNSLDSSAQKKERIVKLMSNNIKKK